METPHTMAQGDPAFQFWQPAMSTCAFPSTHLEKKGTAYHSPPHFFYGCGLAQLIIKIYFLGGRIGGLSLFTAP